VADVARFPVRFTGLNKGMAALGLNRRNSYVEVTPDELVVRMGWGFQASLPLASVASVAEDHDPVWGWGVHGWRGVWLVNGSSSGIVRIGFDPPGRARVLGAPVTLRVLRVAVEDPDGLQAALRPA